MRYTHVYHTEVEMWLGFRVLTLFRVYIPKICTMVPCKKFYQTSGVFRYIFSHYFYHIPEHISWGRHFSNWIPTRLPLPGGVGARETNLRIIHLTNLYTKYGYSFWKNMYVNTPEVW